MAIDLHDYFRLRCSSMLVMERNIWQIYREMIRDTHNVKLKELFEENDTPMRRRISHLEQVIDRQGGIVGPDVDPATRGMMEAYRIFMEQNPPREYVDLHNALEAERIEQMEMGAYDGLLQLAHHLGEEDIAQLLAQNQTGEKHLCDALHGAIPALLAELAEKKRAA